MSLESKTELVMAVKGYECEEIERFDEGIDIIASKAQSNEKILLRFITDTTSKSGVVSIDFVKKMEDSIEQGAYDAGVLIGERFSQAALEEMTRKNIHIVSKKRMPTYKTETLYLTIHRCINDLCKTRCGQVPKKESDCKSHSKDDGLCEIRLISDNALFHFEKGWINLLKRDLIRALKLRARLQNESDFNNGNKSIFQSVSKILNESRDLKR
jgi:hypothetical protein